MFQTQGLAGAAQVREAIIDLQIHLKRQKLCYDLYAFVTYLRESKYRPDQPRAPKGTPEGGQW